MNEHRSTSQRKSTAQFGMSWLLVPSHPLFLCLIQFMTFPGKRNVSHIQQMCCQGCPRNSIHDLLINTCISRNTRQVLQSLLKYNVFKSCNLLALKTFSNQNTAQSSCWDEKDPKYKSMKRP